MRDHVARLQRSGLVRKVAMTRGEGSLVVITRRGAQTVGETRLGAPRSVAPSTWAHAVACAWVAASFEARGRPWVSPREVALDDAWRAQVSYSDASGATRRVLHRPDLGRHLQAGAAAVEVELQRKSRERLRGILEMYARRTLGPDGTLASVVYVAGSQDVANAVTNAAQEVGLTQRVFRLVALEQVIADTRTFCAAPVA